MAGRSVGIGGDFLRRGAEVGGRGVLQFVVVQVGCAFVQRRHPRQIHRLVLGLGLEVPGRARQPVVVRHGDAVRVVRCGRHRVVGPGAERGGDGPRRLRQQVVGRGDRQLGAGGVGGDGHHAVAGHHPVVPARRRHRYGHVDRLAGGRGPPSTVKVASSPSVTLDASAVIEISGAVGVPRAAFDHGPSPTVVTARTCHFVLRAVGQPADLVLQHSVALTAIPGRPPSRSASHRDRGPGGDAGRRT